MTSAIHRHVHVLCMYVCSACTCTCIYMRVHVANQFSKVLNNCVFIIVYCYCIVSNYKQSTNYVYMTNYMYMFSIYSVVPRNMIVLQIPIAAMIDKMSGDQQRPYYQRRERDQFIGEEKGLNRHMTPPTILYYNWLLINYYYNCNSNKN